jgi:hypothetical protein
MDFSIHDFLITTVTGLVGHRPDYNVREMAAGWYAKGVFIAGDLAGIEAAIQAQYPAEPAAEPPAETLS